MNAVPPGVTHVLSWVPAAGGVRAGFWELQAAGDWDGTACSTCTFPGATTLIWPDPAFLAAFAERRLGRPAVVDRAWLRFAHARLRWPFLHVHREPVFYVRPRSAACEVTS